ncbi:2921_t:CDS:2, partial [Scutellospora calospora]
MLRSLKKFNKKEKDNLCLYPGCKNKVKSGRNRIDYNYCSIACQNASFQNDDTEFLNEEYEIVPESYNVDTTETQKWSQQPHTNSVISESTSQPSQSSSDADQWSRNPFRLLQQSSYSRPSQQGYTSTNNYYTSSKQPESNFSIWSNSAVEQDDLTFSPFAQTSNGSEEKTKEEPVQNQQFNHWVEEEEDDLFVDLPINYVRNNPPVQKTRQFHSFSQQSMDAAIRCSACSYLNNPIYSQCEMCYSPIGDLEFLNVPDTNMRQCPVCTYYNQQTMIDCEMCGNYLQEFEVRLNTRMTALEPTSALYIEIYGRFAATMPNARVLAIIRMQMPTRLVEAHEKYKNNMARRSPQRTAASVTFKMFHGTKCLCNPARYIGTDQWTYCPTNSRCGNGNSSTFGKCGGGRMWFAQNSNISFGYCSNTQIKTMYTVDVVSIAPPNSSIIIVDKNEA